jgi:hypothetical protein
MMRGLAVGLLIGACIIVFQHDLNIAGSSDNRGFNIVVATLLVSASFGIGIAAIFEIVFFRFAERWLSTKVKIED